MIAASKRVLCAEDCIPERDAQPERRDQIGNRLAPLWQITLSGGTAEAHVVTDSVR